MGSQAEILGNIDLVKYPQDKTVLLAHTDEAFSVGVVSMPFDATMVLSFTDPIKKTEIPLTTRLLPSTFSILVTRREEEALQIAMGTMRLWMWRRSLELGESDASPLGIGAFTDVDREAPIYAPHMRKLSGEPLKGAELLSQEVKLGKIRDQGFVIPLPPIVRDIQNLLGHYR